MGLNDVMSSFPNKILLFFSCSPYSIDLIYILEFVPHQQIYDKTTTTKRIENHTSLDLIMVIESACMLIS